VVLVSPGLLKEPVDWSLFLLNPPEPYASEKSQMQTLERDRPVLPIGLGYLEGRHGTTRWGSLK
jgi:hypothetical protein